VRRRLNLFLKGNLDLRDTIHSLTINGKVEWNGVNEIVRARFPGVRVRARHETWNRSDALLSSQGMIPEELSYLPLSLGNYSLESQFSHAVFEADADAIIFSIQPDVMSKLMRHKHQKYLLLTQPPYSEVERSLLSDTFESISVLDVKQSMANFAEIIRKCRRDSGAAILIYNLSSIAIGDSVHCYEGLEEGISTRIKTFNLGLIELSRISGISIVDVDAVVARHGADRLKIDTLHLNADGCRLVADEVVRILVDLGCL
jgi:hypothetical protein